MDGAKAMMTIIITAPPGVILSQSNRLQHPARKKKKEDLYKWFSYQQFQLQQKYCSAQHCEFP